MYLKRLPHIVRSLLLTLVVGSIFGAATLTTPIPTHAAGAQPTWALPFSAGTSVYIGPLGLHDHNFGSMKDDRTGKVFTFPNKRTNDSLDFVLATQTPGGTSTIPTTSAASGTVLAVWGICQLVLIDHNNGWWSMYLHLANIQVVSGNTVNPGTILGYPTTNKPPRVCGSVESTAQHVHFVLLNGSGTTGTYVSSLGKVFCGHQVVELNNDPTDIILQGLTQTKDQVFTVPACFTEFPIPTSNSNPNGITAGPDGNLWFTETGGNKIGKMTPGGAFTEYPVPKSNSGLQSITAGPDGNLWFIEGNANQIGRITTGGAITEFPLLTPNSAPNSIIAGPDGNLWFTEYFGNQIGRITPGGTITEFPLPTGGSYPNLITTGSDGNLWFTEYATNKIGRITPGGTVTSEFPIPTSNSLPRGISTGPAGNLWFTEMGGNKIGRMTPGGTIPGEFAVPTSGSRPWVIIMGPDGNLWFTEFFSVNIGQITPGGTITEFPLPNGGSPDGITAGPLNSLWFTEWNGNKIGQILL